MRITSFNPIIGLIPNRNNKICKNMVFTGTLSYANFYDSFSKNPINKLTKFTIDEYKKLNSEDISAIRKNVRKSFVLDEDLIYHDIASSSIQSSLDETFGMGKYVLITIGRSLSSVAKCLSYKIGDENVKQIPMSEAGRFADEGYIENCNEDFDAFNRYLDSIGLSKQDIETSSKTYVITDYCCTGFSLCGAKELLLSDKVWGKQNNVMSVDIMRLIRDKESGTLIKNMLCDNHDFKSLLENIFVERGFKHYSIVNKCANLADTQKSAIAPINYSQEIKYFLFKFMDTKVNK